MTGRVMASILRCVSKPENEHIRKCRRKLERKEEASPPRLRGMTADERCVHDNKNAAALKAAIDFRRDTGPQDRRKAARCRRHDARLSAFLTPF
jgi:hypothetical protein